MSNLSVLFETLARDSHFFIFVKMAFAMVLGGIIGLERELKAKPVGVKTCMIIAVSFGTTALMVNLLRPRNSNRSAYSKVWSYQ